MSTPLTQPRRSQTSTSLRSGSGSVRSVAHPLHSKAPLSDPLRTQGQSAASHSSSQSQPRRVSRRFVPSGRVFFYNISTVGTTFSGNTSFPSPNTSYRPQETFRLPGRLVIEPTIFAQNAGRNGTNSREVGLLIGGDRTLSQAGTLLYGTHTYVHRHWGGRTLGRPAVDTAFVGVNSATGNVAVTVDPQWSRNDTTNLFAWRTSLLSAPKQILQGQIQLRFTNGGRTVAGQARFFGNGFIEPGAYAYTVRFTGSLAG